MMFVGKGKDDDDDDDDDEGNNDLGAEVDRETGLLLMLLLL